MNDRTQAAALRKEYGLGLLALVLVVTGTLLLLQWNTAGGNGTGLANGSYITSGPFQVAVSLPDTTPRVGRNRLLVNVRDGDGNPLQEVIVRAVAEAAAGAMPEARAMLEDKDAMRVPGLVKVAMTPAGDGVFEGILQLPSAGEWSLAVDVGTDTSHHADLVFSLITGQPGLQLQQSTAAGDIAYHTCSMHPSVRSSVPGVCPICSMDLVAVTYEELQTGTITVDDTLRQSIGVTTGQVQRRAFTLPVRLQGEITYDPTRLSDISLRFDGWIGDLNADYVGRAMQRGDRLFSVYSPELLSLQEEYLESLKRRRTQDTVVSAARKRLLLWGLDNRQIKWLEEQGEAQNYLPIFAPHDGIVIEKNVVNGSAFKKGERLLRLADLSQVWVEALAYEKDLPLLDAGMPATVRIPNSTATEYRGELMQVNPFLNGMSRAAHVRLILDNPDHELSPGAYAEVVVQVDLGEQLLVPKEAVLVSGNQRIVFLDLGQGQLKPRRIRTGYSDDRYTVVRRGLQEGDTIVTSGNFLIASESKLKTGGGQW